MSARTCTCGGSGKLTIETPPSGEWRDIGNGLQIGDAGGISSEPCECRKTLPPREGEARWWSVETVWEREWQEFDGEDFGKQVGISVEVEVPYSADNYRLVRNADNVYYPAMVTIGEYTLITIDAVRRLAALLTEAADEADRIDIRDSARDGAAT